MYKYINIIYEAEVFLYGIFYAIIRTIVPCNTSLTLILGRVRRALEYSINPQKI